MGIEWESDVGPAPRRRSAWRTIGIGLVLLILGWFALSIAWDVAARTETNDNLGQIATGDARAREQALRAIAKLGVCAAPAVEEGLKSGDPAWRRAALQAAGMVLASCREKLDEMNCAFGIVPGRGAAESAWERMRAVLREALGDREGAIRIEAARALSLAIDTQQVDLDPMMRQAGAVLRDTLSTQRDPSARKEILELLGRFRPTMHIEGASALLGATGDTDEGVRQAAIRALTDSLGESTCPTEEDLRKKLKEAAPSILRDAKGRKRDAALLALGILGESGAVSELIVLLHDPDPSTRSAAAVALVRLGYLAFQTESVKDDHLRGELRKALPRLVADLENPLQEVRLNAAAALRSMGVAALDAIPAIERAAEREADRYVRSSMTETC
jgi:HEAT repeat protein